MDAYEVTLETVLKGSAKEMFQIELANVAANVGNPSTSLKTVRTITLTFKFTPFADRSGVTVVPTCESKLGQLDTSGVTGTLYLAKRDGKFTFFSRDLSQEQLFFGAEEEAAAGD